MFARSPHAASNKVQSQHTKRALLSSAAASGELAISKGSRPPDPDAKLCAVYYTASMVPAQTPQMTCLFRKLPIEAPDSDHHVGLEFRGARLYIVQFTRLFSSSAWPLHACKFRISYTTVVVQLKVLPPACELLAPNFNVRRL
jgi:hypothetical protein